ncbi:hypothetical protein GCM10009677_48270 [Sphaerisporangium rubeum]
MRIGRAGSEYDAMATVNTPACVAVLPARGLAALAGNAHMDMIGTVRNFHRVTALGGRRGPVRATVRRVAPDADGERPARCRHAVGTAS